MADAPPAPRILRVYLDGPHGAGKSTTARALVALAEAASRRVAFVEEPMGYWRSAFSSDAIFEIYDTQHRLDRKEISPAEAGAFMTSLQMHMATPYALAEEAFRPHVGREAADGAGPQRRDPDATLVVDRHAVASLVCYPMARFLLGCLSLRSVASLVSLLPPPLPGTNLVLATLDRGAHAARLAARARPGERPDVAMLMAIRDVYAMLANTARYLRRGGDWRRDWPALPVFGRDEFAARAAGEGRAIPVREDPGLGDTLFAALKVAELLDPRGRPRGPHARTLDVLAERIGAMHVSVLDLGGTPEECVAALRDALRTLVCTEGASPDSAAELLRAAAAYRAEVALGPDAGGDDGGAGAGSVPE
ncbi:thymidine kinase [Ateline alphaherpesvirus 1]|uniref:Thymidine kinase n=1 Tax=Herpesvirus ateles type 1 (strain Lennette) TaxID=35243 RepID=A0A1S6JLN8_HSVA1|nr:thymidine kinase [Ateline alphaherpesvirus 1]AQS79193.1 thymidine kinase [Ateline alphaherpesvirus 1]